MSSHSYSRDDSSRSKHHDYSRNYYSHYEGGSDQNHRHQEHKKARRNEDHGRDEGKTSAGGDEHGRPSSGGAYNQVAVDQDRGEIKPLEELVRKDSWHECTWEQQIASQHPDWPTEGNRVDGNTFLRPGMNIERILTTCPFGSLRDGSKGEEWFAKKVKAADAAYRKMLDRSDPDDCLLSYSEK